MNLDFLLPFMAMAALIVLYLETRSRQAQMKLSQEFQTMQKSLKETSVLLHTYHKFKIAFDSAYDAMVLTDAKGTITYINDSALSINGYSRPELLGTKAGKRWGGLMPKKVYAQLWDTISVQKQPYQGIFTNHRKNGEQYRAAVTIAPILDDDSRQVIGYVAIERDMSRNDSSILPRDRQKKLSVSGGKR